MSNVTRFLVKLPVLRKAKWRTCLIVTLLKWGDGDCHYYPSCSVHRRKHISTLSAVSVFQGPEGHEMNCCAGKLFNRKAQLGVTYSYLPSLLSVDVFSSLICSVCLTTCSAPGCKVTCLLCHCFLDLLSVSWFLVMSGCFTSSNNAEFLRC